MNNNFSLNEGTQNFKNGAVDVIVFGDDYACGHQSGLTLIMHDKRLASNGDVRFEQTPGQWQPIPVRMNRTVDKENVKIVADMHFPDTRSHLRGFNPAIFPDVELNYHIEVKPCNKGVSVSVLLDNEIPATLKGKACFNLEIVPVHVVGKPWIMDNQCGIFPTQPNGPTMSQPANINTSGVYDKGDGKADLDILLGNRLEYNPIVADDIVALPYAEGHKFTALPDSDLYKFSVYCEDTLLKLYDGRMNHNNGWFVLSSELPVNKTGNVLTWIIEPTVNENFVYKPVVGVSQVGYYPKQPKFSVIECDANHYTALEKCVVSKISADGIKPVFSEVPRLYGDFLRYKYAICDFSSITEEGLYQIEYAGSKSAIFKISSDAYSRGVWQPVLEYFLPVQMCHMMVREKYRIWHGLCHNDDAIMAPTNFNHIDGYVQGPDTLTKYKSGEHVPGLNKGGWHDAGDYDLRIESQAGEVYILSEAFEEFDVYWDSTTIDQDRQCVEIHEPDGRNDILEQIEHGLLSIIGAYESLGRLYRGIICRDLRQYVLLGDGSRMTDGVVSDDDRWVFTEDNPRRELEVASQLAASYRAMKGFNDELSKKALKISKELYSITNETGAELSKVHAAVELFKSTGEDEYKDYILKNTKLICENFNFIGRVVAKVVNDINDEAFKNAVREAAISHNESLKELYVKTPYGVPYNPGPWGSGWNIQNFGYRYHFLHKAFPDIYEETPMVRALDFILGCHPGTNTSSFASGVGAKSITTAYCANRADYSFIPGGVSSGTELINPDFPELLEFPYLWQQGEYVLGGGSSHYMFLVLAVKALYE